MLLAPMWVEAKDTAKRLAMNRTGPHNKECPAHNARSAGVEKP